VGFLFCSSSRVLHNAFTVGFYRGDGTTRTRGPGTTTRRPRSCGNANRPSYTPGVFGSRSVPSNERRRVSRAFPSGASTDAKAYATGGPAASTGFMATESESPVPCVQGSGSWA
jgi:hypothetical protein